MSLSISDLSPAHSAVDTTTQTAAQTKPTLTQELHQLRASGLSSAQIASRLGLPVAQVDASLGIKAAAVQSSEEAVITPGSLSVKA